MTTKLVAFDKLTMTTYICMCVLVCVQVIVNWSYGSDWVRSKQRRLRVGDLFVYAIYYCYHRACSSVRPSVRPSVVLFLIQHIIIYSSCVRFAAFRSEYQNGSDCNKSQSIYIHTCLCTYEHTYIHTYVFRCCSVVTLWSTEVF